MHAFTARRAIFAITLLAIVFAVATGADAQSRRRNDREPKQTEHAAPNVTADKRDSVVTAAGTYAGRPYWLALAQCGGAYFKLNQLYADIAARSRSVKPDPKITTEYTKKLNDAIKTATTFFTGAERFLMTDRGIERVDAVLTYDQQSLAVGDRLKTIDAALSAAKACPALYQACREAYPKACAETLAPTS